MLSFFDFSSLKIYLPSRFYKIKCKGRNTNIYHVINNCTLDDFYVPHLIPVKTQWGQNDHYFQFIDEELKLKLQNR
jgi:hypothetical protein